MTSWRVIEADCVEAMAAMPEASVDAVVTDPPAGIGFMGREWDHDRGGMDAWIDWMTDVMREVLRVAKPGAHALVWALPRTSHWTGLALERAGWDVRDVVTHLFGSGFPKSFNLPDGQGTALKPAAEFWFLARKPLAGTVSQTVLEHGTGALNVDGCRIDGVKPVMERTSTVVAANAMAGESTGATSTGEMTTEGRWPANVVLDEQAAAMLDEQTGDLPTQATRNAPARNGDGGMFGLTAGGERSHPGAGESGGASRFFYCAKSSSAERNAGLDGFEERAPVYNGQPPESAGLAPGSVEAKFSTQPRANVHPTVKPIALMRWLVRLVTPPGGTVLDPFTGSGTTGCAAMLEGFDFTGIERESEYAAIARARIEWWAEHPEGVELVDRLDAEQTRRAVADAGQLQMFGNGKPDPQVEPEISPQAEVETC